MYKLKYIIFLLMILPVNTFAKTYYSDYSEFSEYSEELVEATDLIEVESETRYLGYTERYEYLSDETESSTGEISYENERWVNDKPEYIIDTKKTYKYYEYLEDRRLNIINTNNYDITFNNIIAGSDLVMNRLTLKPGQSFVLKIDDDKSAEVGINITASSDAKSIKYQAYLSAGDKKSKIFDEDLQTFTTQITFYPDKFGDLYKEPYESEELLEINGKVEEVVSYLTADKLYETKFIDYKDEYYTKETDEYKLDLEKEKTFYRFKTREKLELKSNVIEDSKTLIEDLIESTTDYKIVSDVNYKVNGTYRLNIVTPYITIEEEITIDNKENLEILIKELTNDLVQTKEQLIQTNYQVEKKNQEIKEVVLESDDEFLETENEKLKTELTETKEIKKDLVTEKVKKSSLVISLILMLILLLIPLFRREKDV